MRRPRGVGHRVLLVAALLAGHAGGHGENVPPELGGVTLCVASGGVQVTLEALTDARQQGALAGLAEDLRQEMTARLERQGVRVARPRWCWGRDGILTVAVNVRYLNPATYRGFGDPAYSYGVQLAVQRRWQRSPPRFDAGYTDIHSESRSGRPVRGVVAARAAELTDDLAQAWVKANPRR
ncbi:hypothetical protein HNQ07_003376 [Deinococcus metalli]|uniref:Uncharacterized protein n=1 Tax=Deinococcus metalli TaxID=1141878 RepID=A0A7W8KGQ7_9DEIO|nr:hypothetical protein [Deinococcus metalli]MBB5377876.1 hypothetical protein [Deinococcus metalli]GHF55339.1 hypothetical protein GCM10017781_34590 [Deinococcus metalli]